jgi:hypothetical protein
VTQTREERLARERKHYAENRAAIAAYRHEFRIANADKVRARDRARYHANPNRVKAIADYCSTHQEQKEGARRTRSNKRRNAGVCTRCGLRPRESGKLCPSCRVRVKVLRQRSSRAFKMEVMRHYGGCVCACCGETELSFLTLDHINGNGKADRKSLGVLSGAMFYRAIRRLGYPAGLQVLCANCHLSKTVLGQCIHKNCLGPTGKGVGTFETNRLGPKNRLSNHGKGVPATWPTL